ncbi:ATP-dependent zinc protease family protein [Immundisolibacter sp.]
MRHPYAALVLLLCSFAGLVGSANARGVYGWVEFVELYLDGQQFNLKAKLDTGARSSSLDATDITPFERDGQHWVRFRVNRSGLQEAPLMEQPVARYVRIKRHSGPYDHRPVIRLPLCLGDELRTIDVNLTDRGRFIYPLLLGRKALARLAVVDPARTFIREPACTPGATGE